MIKIRSAEILCVGTEILIGDIVNTNAAYISSRLAALGIPQYYQGVVGDNPERLTRRLTEALERCDLVVMTGGLGPTYDDLTKETAARVMGRRLVPDARSMERMRARFDKMCIHMTHSNDKQAWMPEGSVIFDNDWGTAPGCAIEDEEKGKIILMLPGPPSEMKPMFDFRAEPYLTKFSTSILVSRNVNIAGIGESAVEDILTDFMKRAENPTVAPYCKEGEVRLRVTAKAASTAEGLALCDGTVGEIMKTGVGPYVYGVDTTLEEALVALLTGRKLKIATAESCTGGMISQRITSVPGASAVFDGGVASYANEVKMKLLGVSSDTLSAHGAVSEETAREMAEGVRSLMSADLAVGVTGIAGPDGGTPEKPVGLVYIGLAVPGTVKAYRFVLTGNRDKVRHLASNAALRLAVMYLRSGQIG